ncbi:MAG: TlpA family protein disulfide reductase [Vicingus serpentipes]|nr:TlpA family protein disulfide reductase [Vicingus serpentipes]
MIKRAFLFHIILLFIVSFINASNTVIKGKVSSFNGKEISIYTYTDYITQTQEKIGFTNIQSDGNFQFQFDANTIKKVMIKIEDKTTWFFAEPGKVYHINLSYDEAFNKGRIYDKLLSLKFNFPVPNELNQQVKKFNQHYDDFIEENKSLFEKRNREIEPKIEAFEKEMLKKVENSSSAFIKSYITYSIASMFNSLDVSYNVYTSGKNSQDTKANIYLKYLDKQPVVYDNPEYMLFFKAFFKGEFKKLTLQKVKGFDISTTINDDPSYPKLSEILGKYPFLTDDEFKNLFLLNGLQEVYGGKYFNNEHILQLLNEIAISSKYPEQKIIAKNIIKKITLKKFGEGSKAPSFALKNGKEELINSNSFEGKHLYINFFTTWSIPALKEMKVMHTMYKKYQGKIEFISICADNDFSKLTKFLNENPNYEWTFLHVGNDKNLTEKYQVKTFPSYILVDKKGIVIKAPAGRPGGTAERATEDNIEKDFYDLINRH